MFTLNWPFIRKGNTYYFKLVKSQPIKLSPLVANSPSIMYPISIKNFAMTGTQSPPISSHHNSSTDLQSTPVGSIQRGFFHPFFFHDLEAQHQKLENHLNHLNALHHQQNLSHTSPDHHHSSQSNSSPTNNNNNNNNNNHGGKQPIVIPQGEIWRDSQRY